MRFLLAGVVLVVLGGCGGHGAQATSDCSRAIRTGEAVYVEAGFVKGSAQRDGQAEYASCDDIGEDASGAYFPNDAHMVQVWSFEGQDRNTVLAIREGEHFRVFVAEGQDPAKVVREVRRSLHS